MTRKPTIATVAERAGVAVSTVSRYLNGRYVSREAKARIADAIETLGYARSWTARNLSIGRKGCIGVVVDAKENAVPFYRTFGFEPLEIEAGSLGDRPSPTPMFLELGAIPNPPPKR